MGKIKNFIPYVWTPDSSITDISKFFGASFYISMFLFTARQSTEKRFRVDASITNVLINKGFLKSSHTALEVWRRGETKF